VQLGADSLHRFARRAFIFAQCPALLGQRGGRRNVLVATGLADQSGEEFHLGAESFGLLEQLAVFDVEGDDFIHCHRRDAATGQRGLHDVWFTT
jgi:hypothetical protein